MDRFLRYGNLLRPDGTNQLQRLLPALEPGYILPDERSLTSLLKYARQLAAEIHFYSLTGQATGDWRGFLEALATSDILGDADSLEAQLQTRRDWSPHLALFLVFLKLFSYLQADLNELPQRHLRHYYEQELDLQRRSAQADAVHVIFELARNVAATLIPAQTLLDAGKDGQGQPLQYATQADLVVSAAQVSDLRRLVGETDRRGFWRFFEVAGITELEGESWYTFGRRQLDLDPSQRFMTEAQLGFAIAAPILRLAEGQRQVRVLATLRSTRQTLPASQELNSAFTVDLSGAEGWLEPDTVQAQLIHSEADQSLTLNMTLTLSEAAPAIVAVDPALHAEGPVSNWPVLRCRLNSGQGYYETLAGLTVASVTTEVSVSGVKNLVVQNGQGQLTPDQPMPLFGSQPRLGLPFYIGSSEVFSKRLTALTLHLEWQDLPEGLGLFDHYRAYFDATALRPGLTLAELEAQFRGDFVAFVDLLYNRRWYALLPSDRALFEDASSRTITVSASNFAALATQLSPGTYAPQPQLQSLDTYAIDTQFGFLRLTLQGPRREDSGTAFEAFGHQMFASRYATQAIALSRWDGTLPEPPLPNPPLTPSLASLSLDYQATMTFTPGTSQSESRFFRLEPFGYAVASATVSARLVPDMGIASLPQDSPAPALGALYVGLIGLTPPVNVSLLFQIDKGTAGTANILNPTATEWSYLSGNTWTALPRDAILNDSTYGFQEPGLVVLALGRNASVEHRAMPTGKVWLRALIHQAPESAARTLALRSQAVLATLMPADGNLSTYADHLQAGLATETIQRLKRRVAAIKAVHQPFRSFGGRSSETDEDFFRRCSERLRHRHRAVTTWDFERLVLEAFPEIFKVKCLPHSNAEGDAKAGDVALVVVPDVRSLPSLEPRAGEVLIRRISDYVNTALATPVATVHVIHPLYERIRVDARVAFRSGLDAGYYMGVLNQDLQRFLSPWAYAEGKDIVFGGQIYRSEILAFVEGRDYVDYVTDFSLYHSHSSANASGVGSMTIGVDFFIRPDPTPQISAQTTGMTIGDTFIVGRGVEVTAATKPQTILVSHIEHRITPINVGEKTCFGVKTLGIGYMTVSLDFEVSKPV